jgi:hypothetical protein
VPTTIPSEPSFFPTSLPSLVSRNDISYAPGYKVMTGTVKLYNIYFGKIDTSSKDLIDYFAINVGKSAWYGITTAYYQIVNGITTYISDDVQLGGSISVGSDIVGGHIDGNNITLTISNAISTGLLPLDSNGIYAFMFRGNISIPGFLTSYCGYHSSFRYKDGTYLKYFMVGDPSSMSSHSCSAYVNGPTANNDPGADSVVSTYAHELTETVTDYSGAWYWRKNDSSYGEENADLCAWKFGSLLPGTNNANIIVGSKKFLVQQNWLPRYGCRSALLDTVAPSMSPSGPSISPTFSPTYVNTLAPTAAIIANGDGCNNGYNACSAGSYCSGGYCWDCPAGQYCPGGWTGSYAYYCPPDMFSTARAASCFTAGKFLLKILLYFCFYQFANSTKFVTHGNAFEPIYGAYN